MMWMWTWSAGVLEGRTAPSGDGRRADRQYDRSLTSAPPCRSPRGQLQPLLRGTPAHPPILALIGYPAFSRSRLANYQRNNISRASIHNSRRRLAARHLFKTYPGNYRVTVRSPHAGAPARTAFGWTHPLREGESTRLPCIGICLVRSHGTVASHLHLVVGREVIQMKRAMAFIAVGVLFLVGCGNPRNAEGGLSREAPLVQPAFSRCLGRNSHTSRSRRSEGGTWSATVHTTGTVGWDANHTTQASTQVSGPIVRILVDTGALLKAGDPLLLRVQPRCRQRDLGL
jgi:hypothetical protein